MLLSLHFRSTGADAILHHAAENPDDYRARREARDKSVKLIVDHAVPLSVVVGQLFETGADLSRDGIRTHLERLYHLGLLTDAEDAALNRLKLRSRMPAAWNGADLAARYRAAGIEASGQPNVSG